MRAKAEWDEPALLNLADTLKLPAQDTRSTFGALDSLGGSEGEGDRTPKGLCPFVKAFGAVDRPEGARDRTPKGFCSLHQEGQKRSLRPVLCAKSFCKGTEIFGRAISRSFRLTEAVCCSKSGSGVLCRQPQ